MANSARLGLTASLCQDLLPGRWVTHANMHHYVEFLIVDVNGVKVAYYPVHLISL